MKTPSGFEARLLALLRSRRTALGLILLGAAGYALVRVLTGGEDAGSGAQGALTAAGLLLPVVMAHGMVSRDLRTGVSLLWLQKPIHPLAFYGHRLMEVTLSTALVALALTGLASALLAARFGAQAGSEMLLTAPLFLLWSLCVTCAAFAFSSWGTSLDSALVLALTLLSFLAITSLEGLPVWLLMPVTEIIEVQVAARGRGVDGVGSRLLAIARFSALAVLVGLLGLVASTRSPFPRDASR